MLLMIAMLRDRRGSAAVEFAILAPIMITLLFGMTDLTQGMLARKRVNHLNAAIADIVAQKRTWTADELEDLFQVSPALLAPMSDENLSVCIVSLSVDEDKVARVQWSRNSDGATCSSQNVDSDTPESMRQSGNAIIRAETTYTYHSPFANALPTTIDFKPKIYAPSRFSTPITLDD